MRSSRATLVLLLASGATALHTLGRAPVLRSSRLAALPRMLVGPEVLPSAATAPAVLEHVGNALAFSDQQGNLAGTFFQFSLPSYLVFLYFIGYQKNRTPELGQFGFQFLLLFVISTIPTGIISKATYGCTLADADWLHGSAEALLTVTNLLIVGGFSAASSGDAEGARGELPRKIALGIAALVAVVCASGTTLGFGAHTPFFFGLGNVDAASLPFVSHAEPANALSLPTWAIHFSSVFEWLFAMQIVWNYAEVTGNPRWKGLTWGMLPLHASGLAACTYHFFFNPSSLQFLVELQAFLTLVGNTTLAIAAIRIALSNGWQLSELNPFSRSDEDAPSTEAEALPALKTVPAENGLLLTAKLLVLTFTAAYAVKYGELALDVPFTPNALLAALMVGLPPAYVGYLYYSAASDEQQESLA